MIAMEGRIALGLDEFMLRLGHLTVLSHVATTVNHRASRFERDLAMFLTRPTAIAANTVGRVTTYLIEKKLCPVAGRASDGSRGASDYRYPHLEVVISENDEIGRNSVRSIDGAPLAIWWQDYQLSDERLESAVGAVTVGG